MSILNYTQFNHNDLVIVSEKFLTNQITEKEFQLQFSKLNENIFSDIKAKITEWIKWFVTNITKMGSKVSTYFKSGVEKIKPLFRYNQRFALMVLTVLIMASSMSLQAQNPDGDKLKKDMIEVVGYASKQIDITKSVGEYNERTYRLERLIGSIKVGEKLTDKQLELYKSILQDMDEYKKQDPGKYEWIYQVGDKLVADLEIKINQDQLSGSEKTAQKSVQKTTEKDSKINNEVQELVKKNNIKGTYYVGVEMSQDQQTAREKSDMIARGKMNTAKNGVTTTTAGHVITKASGKVSTPATANSLIQNADGTYTSISIIYDGI